MAVWQISSDAKAQTFRHRFERGLGHALLAQVVGGIFNTLHVSASLWQGGFWWFLHWVPNLSSFESEHGVETERQAYNERSLAAVLANNRGVRGDHAGCSDFFVPVIVDGQVAAILVVGPFVVERSTSAAILERWRMLTGRHGDLADREFSLYLERSFSTLVLDGHHAAELEELLECLARLLAVDARADETANRADQLRAALEPIRRTDRTWEAVQSMVDERSSRTWASAHQAYSLGLMGLPKLADHIGVGLFGSALGSDPVDERVRRDAFQRKVTHLARSSGSAISGRVEDRGIVLLTASKGSRESKRQRLMDLIERVRLMARRELGLALHFGIKHAPGSVPLSRSYQAALAGAEIALARGTKIELVEADVRRPVRALRLLRRELLASLGERPGVLLSRFDRYLDAVRAAAGDRVEVARGELDAGLERVTEALLQAGVLDEQSSESLLDALDRAAAGAHGLPDLSAAYRQTIVDLSDAVERPTRARRARSLRSALDYIHGHFAERISFAQVAKASGFEPKYFSRLFKLRQEKTFEAYVLGLRLERGKHLLSSTRFDVARVAALSGFSSAQYFCRVFRRQIGKTPLEFRRMSEV